MAISDVLKIPDTMAPPGNWQVRRLYVRFRYTDTATTFTLEIRTSPGGTLKRTDVLTCSGGQGVAWWNGTDDNGANCAGGTYSFKIIVGSSNYSATFLLVR